ncbi:restriction endonuclease fold toxin 5 domain-containing protein [Hyalangium rubrum]|uniref:Restriction endonuclease fold toxin 5 domain-containing protein n=1 Tax=Hyalangium rubrum TaxID=3103134 RepID=A0ABU5HI61_9BACT|nr:restriction endonuclease fold toxin 5 domain-containing protein [Hyalangium sp. s54d21]MDY7233163.1 restriction endonuclease fold toxin 5 domain-containing protein [Hyalangium sp. s54d21]
MAPRLAVVFLLVLSACSTPRGVRLDTGQGAPRQYVPPTRDRFVEVDADAFEQALSRLVLEAPLTLRPAPKGGLVRASYSADPGQPSWQHWMRKSLGGVCGVGQPKDGCLSLLDDVMGLSEGDKLAVALGLSLEPMRQGIAEAVEDTLAPQLFYAAIATSLVTWVVLAANPEPVFTKAAAIVSAVMLVYLGVDAFLDVLKASFELKRATDRATTFEELEEASQRYGSAVGPRFARAFILAVTVLVSRGTAVGASGLASRLPLLPHFSEASALGASQLGIRLAQVGQVSAVAVVEGTLVISLAPTAVAMAAMGPGDGGARAPPAEGPGEWVQVDESMSESARGYQAQVTGAPKGYAYRVKAGGKEADFDGYQEGVLLEAKGPHLARFIDDTLEPKSFFKGADKLLEQAERQIMTARGTPIRWIVAEEKFAAALRKLFGRAGLKIQVVHVPPAP